MKGIVLAGGTGSRLHPATSVVSKQLLPVYDKPMVFYPLTTLMLAGIRDILIITTPRDQAAFSDLLQDGSQWGVNIQYAVQPEPNGIAQAFLIGRDFLAGDHAALVLGDNIFYGEGFGDILRRAASREQGATVFGYWVADPERYGVLDLDAQGGVKAIIEKPNPAPTNWAVTGLYFYDNQVSDIAAALKPSKRGELEITDLNNAYLARGQLSVEKFGRGFAWLDTGTPDSLLDAANFMATVEKRQGLKIAVPEEVAWRLGFIDRAQVERRIAFYKNNAYAQYLSRILNQAG
ncbi:glucose-1-phosphate thymidylyltransferase RfbA [Ferrovibrio sp.]|uniref:glucose-1-phosphate thymidylyltransferase RfbA n=1 Tax=Ferrovibrio sp. TaxID=1917215 RepID=UPI0025B8D27E|nr:glucose-1-phosphate thymidylyltransferase RfbA [Ferrovibrio sp.]MBX3455071.1 glucose-1-phosphate thymidylyltransferase RfbA [Ferrovibrio sp.]